MSKLPENPVTYEIRKLLEEIYGMEKAAESFDKWHDKHDLSEEMVEYGDPIHDRSGDTPSWLLERVEYLSSLLVLPGEEQVSEDLSMVALFYRDGDFESGKSSLGCVAWVKGILEKALEDLLDSDKMECRRVLTSRRSYLFKVEFKALADLTQELIQQVETFNSFIESAVAEGQIRGAGTYQLIMLFSCSRLRKNLKKFELDGERPTPNTLDPSLVPGASGGIMLLRDGVSVVQERLESFSKLDLMGPIETGIETLRMSLKQLREADDSLEGDGKGEVRLSEV